MHAAIAEHPDAATVTLEIIPLQLSVQAVSALIEAHLIHDDRPTGIYAFNDEYALYLLGGLAQRGIRIPQEVGIVGTDNLSFCEGTWPSLTSISLDGEGLGKRSAELLHALHQGRPIPEDLTNQLVPRLIHRGST